MPKSILLANTANYEGKYVALRSFNNSQIVAYGDDPLQVVKKAAEQQIEEPVIFFVPEKPEKIVASIY